MSLVLTPVVLRLRDEGRGTGLVANDAGLPRVRPVATFTDSVGFQRSQAEGDLFIGGLR